jgi:hypothetical protein
MTTTIIWGAVLSVIVGVMAWGNRGHLTRSHDSR